MQLVDLIEKRRFVGREFLLWLWFESELFDATLSTREHGPFGLWLERRLVLSEGKESTRITSPMPGQGREAKEALLRGQLPESAGIRIAWHGDETALVLKAETLAVSGLKLQTILGGEAEPPSALIEEMKGAPSKPKPRREADDTHEVFYERMQMTAEFEELLETLYRDFLTLRLSERWDDLVAPMMRGWILGAELETADYELVRRAPIVTPTSQALELKTGRNAVRVPPLRPESIEQAAAATHDVALIEQPRRSATAFDGLMAAEGIGARELDSDDAEILEVSEADVEEVALESLGNVSANELADVLDEPQVAAGE